MNALVSKILETFFEYLKCRLRLSQGLHIYSCVVGNLSKAAMACIGAGYCVVDLSDIDNWISMSIPRCPINTVLGIVALCWPAMVCFVLASFGNSIVNR